MSIWSPECRSFLAPVGRYWPHHMKSTSAEREQSGGRRRTDRRPWKGPHGGAGRLGEEALKNLASNGHRYKPDRQGPRAHRLCFHCSRPERRKRAHWSAIILTLADQLQRAVKISISKAAPSGAQPITHAVTGRGILNAGNSPMLSMGERNAKIQKAH
jgi:hypothetical protein